MYNNQSFRYNGYIVGMTDNWHVGTVLSMCYIGIGIIGLNRSYYKMSDK